jgi:ATP-dependent protease ClpP protease subunit
MPVSQDQAAAPLNLLAEPPASARPRTLYITGSVDSDLAHAVIVALEQLDRTDGDIRIVLNSDGGSERDGYAIYDALMMCRNKVTIDGYGSVQSIAAAIFQAADVRRMTPNTIFMIHNGNYNDLEPTMPQDQIKALAEEIDKENQRYYTILANASQQDPETIKAWCKDETTFHAQEALDACFCDEIIQPVKTRVPIAKKRKRSKR